LNKVNLFEKFYTRNQNITHDTKMFKTNLTLKLTRLLLATLIEGSLPLQTKTMLCNRKQKNTQSFKNVSEAH